MTRSQVAAAVRKQKEEHPEAYCWSPSCLWRVTHLYGRPDTPCPKHMPAKPQNHEVKQ